MRDFDEDDLGYWLDDPPRLQPEVVVEPRWTLRRVIFLLLILITLIAFLAYILFTSGLLLPPKPPPLPPPLTQPFQQI